MCVTLQYGNTANVWEFAVNIMSLRGCHQISSEIVGHVVEVSHYYLSVSVQTFKSGAFSHILYLFCHVFLSNTIPFWCMIHRNLSWALQWKIKMLHLKRGWILCPILNPMWIWYISFGKIVFNYMHKPKLQSQHKKMNQVKINLEQWRWNRLTKAPRQVLYIEREFRGTRSKKSFHLSLVNIWCNLSKSFNVTFHIICICTWNNICELSWNALGK